jgi:protein-tyrosine phosphatase
VTESPLGRTVDFRLIPVRAYAEFLEDVHKPVTKAVFDLLADETAYPLYYHCWGGADRTGTIAYLLEALLGVPEDDLILDYELTSLSIWGNRERNSSLFSAFEEQLRTYDEDGTPQSRAEAYLLSCGVTPETIEKLRNNLLE